MDKDDFKIGDVVKIVTQKGKIYVGRIESFRLDNLFGDLALVNTLNAGDIWFGIEQLEHLDLQKLLEVV